MASHSQQLQRTRKPQAHPSTPGHMQTREMSPSPTLRPRNMKAASMPIVPSVMHMFQQGNGSPTSANRSPPNSRLLPSPPHQRHSPAQDVAAERDVAVTPPHHPRPINRGPPPEFLTKLDENWKMTDELMAEIERADLQQSQQGAAAAAAAAAAVSMVPTKLDPAVERIRAADRVSPKTLDSQQQQQQQQGQQQTQQQQMQQQQRQRQQPLRESPKARQSVSPPTSAFVGQNSPVEYGSYSVEQPRRMSNAAAAVLLAVGTHGQTPPLQAMTANSRSLPVQEEQEDELPAAAASNHIQYAETSEHSSSPTPSSDANPYDPNMYTHGGRNSRAEHRAEDVTDEDEDTMVNQDDSQGGFTPRSPQSSLPLDDAFEPDRYMRYSSHAANVRGRTRNGSTDQLGLHSLDPAMFVALPPDPERAPPPRYVEPRRQQLQQQQQQQQQYYAHEFEDHYMDHPQLQAYFRSPRPEAPIPPTTAAPSPSPLNPNYRAAAYSPVVPVGSPYPYPFNHVRRTHSYPYQAPRRQPSTNYEPVQQHQHQQQQQHDQSGINNDPSAIQEQLVRQWQVYAQNAGGDQISESTFSPASTPFQGGAYNPWAFLHTNRTLRVGGRSDLRSMQSSPSHEPIALPIPPTVGVKKMPVVHQPPLRRLSSARKPPPRVESTQPRSTPEPEESSGEETAGEMEEQKVVEVSATVTEGSINDDGDWVDEDEDGDEEDLLDLEYHPTFVGNVEKRRRRWETRWDALVQAFNALDRQTDATLVLLAAPSHSTKLHSLTSRSIRRSPLLAQSLGSVRSGFRQVAHQRRAARASPTSLADRFMGTDGSSDSSIREEDLRRALGTALGSLGALKGIYEQREARWIDEMRRISEDRERVEVLLRQVLGEEMLAM